MRSILANEQEIGKSIRTHIIGWNDNFPWSSVFNFSNRASTHKKSYQVCKEYIQKKEKKKSLMKIEFEKQFGKGVDPWYAKADRWIKKKFRNPYLQHLALGFLEWLKEKWIDAKVFNTMKDVDIQVEEIKKTWDEEEKVPEIIETPSEVKGLNDMEIGKFN